MAGFLYAVLLPNVLLTLSQHVRAKNIVILWRGKKPKAS